MLARVENSFAGGFIFPERMLMTWDLNPELGNTQGYRPNISFSTQLIVGAWRRILPSRW